MKSLKKVLTTVLLSTTLLISGVVSTTVFAYSDNVEKKLEKINKNIEKQNEKLSKQNQKRSNRNNSSSSSSSSSSSGSSSTKSEKIQKKISELQEDMSDIKAKEDAKIAKVVKSIEGRKKQSNNKIENLNKLKTTKNEAARKKYENDVKARKAIEPTYVAPAFKFNSSSIDRQIAEEKEKLRDYDADISKARGTSTKKPTKKSK